ncbi:hypothetical protein PHJA_000527800 [Phtheirospermum japonicum]|uniref:Uncharacterized protein n=1 Tax=Phtheirospermum japonicum TaxID=374723 RepID=A0A830BCM2_9LAMI|nr:hypothetical protein PHJA_000527800 [Phtheirospermum japonicum]
MKRDNEALETRLVGDKKQKTDVEPEKIDVNKKEIKQNYRGPFFYTRAKRERTPEERAFLAESVIYMSKKLQEMLAKGKKDASRSDGN